jgi:hypothetical protein
MNCNWGNFVIEDDDVFLCSGVFLMYFDLENFCCEPVAETKIGFENRGYSLKCKHRSGDCRDLAIFLHIGSLVCVKRMLYIGVREATFYSVEVCQRTERQVVDFKRIVELESLAI